MWNRVLAFARVVLAGGSIGFSLGCAEGLPGPEAMVEGFIGVPPTAGAAADGADAAVGGAGTGMGPDVPPPPVFAGEACTMGQMQPCTCPDGGQGNKVCRFDASSPTMGAFGMCEGCQAPPPEAGMGGASGMGTSGMGASGMGASGMGASGMGASGSGGGGMGASGSGGGGSGGSNPNEPVQDCEGVPEGTLCDRDCILPSNTARCNRDGRCSCL